MNLFTWLRIFIFLKCAQFRVKQVQRDMRSSLRSADLLVKSDPTNEQHLAFQRDVRAMARAREGPNRTMLAAINIELDRLDTFRR